MPTPQAYPAAGAQGARYGAAAHAETDADAEPPGPERTQVLENMAENRAGTGAIGHRAELLADREAERRAQIGQEPASPPPAREPQAEQELQAWQQGEAERPSAAAAPEADASPDAPEISGEELEPGL
jgi:hypothetical protein